jgi:NAD(P)-dependent dehydrogenase (short-subunit alcohol dehydrogenase family)
MSVLDGEAVVITGAGRGLGAAYARACAAAGAAVVVNDIDPATAGSTVAQIRAAGGRAVAEPRDITRESEARALIDRCICEFGFISGLVNNAAVMLPDRLETADAAALRAMFEVNVIGAFNCARAAVGPMVARGGGSIVNVTSGAQTGQDALSGYGASKGAVASFTYGWAGELAAKGVRVNAISPMAEGAMTADMEAYLKRQGLPMTHWRLPPPEVNAPVVVYLLSSRSKGVTGQLVRIVGSKLSLMSHPAVRTPILEHEAWTAELIAEAFETTLAANQLPTDVAVYDIASVTR